MLLGVTKPLENAVTMPDYLTDIHLDGDRDIHLDDANDLALVSGRRNLEQSVMIAVGGAIERFVGGNIDGTTVSLLEERIRQALDVDPQIETVRSVSVEQFDRRNDTITLDVSVGENEDFTIEVTA